MAQAIHCGCFDITVEIEDENPRTGFGILLRQLGRLGLAFALLLELLLVDHGLLETLTHRLIEIVEFVYFQMATRLLGSPTPQRCKRYQHHQHGGHQRHGFSQKACIVSKKLHRSPLNR